MFQVGTTYSRSDLLHILSLEDADGGSLYIGNSSKTLSSVAPVTVGHQCDSLWTTDRLPICHDQRWGSYGL